MFCKTHWLTRLNRTELMNILESWTESVEQNDPLTGSEFAVLIFLKNKGIWKKSKRQLGQDLKLGTRTVFRVVTKLSTLGYIKEVEPKDRHDKRYPYLVFVKGTKNGN